MYIICCYLFFCNSVVAVDLRGCGYSEKFYSKSEYKMEALVGDVKNLIDALGACISVSFVLVQEN